MGGILFLFYDMVIIFSNSRTGNPASYWTLSSSGNTCTFNNRLVYIRTFLSWCVDEGYIHDNPLKNLKKRKDEGRVVNIDVSIMKKLLELPVKDTFAGLRDYCLILLTIDTGIRPKEALSLMIEDFNPTACEIYISSKNAKTRVSRTLPISLQTVKAIRTLVHVRSKEWGELTPIFCTIEGKKMNRHTWGDRLEYYSKILGYHIRPYDLRHFFAIEYIRNGAHALSLQRILGHSDLTMTKRYVALTNNDLRDQHAIASPINRLLVERSRINKIR